MEAPRNYSKKLRSFSFAIALAMLEWSGTAHADIFDFVSASHALTSAAPTLSTQGLSLSKRGPASGFRVIVSAQAGATVTGGTARCYFFGPVTTRWMRCPNFDVTLTTGVRDSVSVDFHPLVGWGRIYYATDAVTVSAGTTVTVTVEASYESP